MLKFILRRFVQALLTLFALSIILFGWLRLLPGGPVSALLGERGTEEDRVRLEAALGLDLPLPVQYIRFVQRSVRGEFGASTGVLPGTDAMEVFLTKIDATVELSFFALILASFFGIFLGFFAAKRSGGTLDNSTMTVSLVGIAVPVFFLAFLLKYFFAIKLGWLPPSGRASIGMAPEYRLTGLFVVDSLLTGDLPKARDALVHLILPTVALSSIPFAVIFRITRASVLDVLDEDYVRTAHAKGLTDRVIRGRHVLRNALIPVLTILGIQTGGLLAGAILTEKVFNFPGIGQALALGFETRDYAVLQVLIMMAALLYITINLLVDVAYAVADPRVRTGS